MRWTSYLFLLLIVFAIGCKNSPTGPSEGGIPANPTAGEFGYTMNGTSIDRKDYSLGSQAKAIMTPNSGIEVNPNSQLLFVDLTFIQTNLFAYHYTDIGIGIPILAPVPQTFKISTSSDPTNAVAYLNIDSVEYDSQIGGTVTITKFDTVNNLVSGTFSFTAARKNDPSFIKTISSGYFNDVPIYLGGYNQGYMTAYANNYTFATNTSSEQSVSAYSAQGEQQVHLLALDFSGSVQRQLEIDMPIPKVGAFTFSIAVGPSSVIGSYITSGDVQDVNVSTQSSGSGALTISQCDPIHHRFSGTFHFTAVDQNSGQTITIANGQINNLQWYVL